MWTSKNRARSRLANAPYMFSRKLLSRHSAKRGKSSRESFRRRAASSFRKISSRNHAWRDAFSGLLSERVLVVRPAGLV
jgi:hypothetical protein